jgi:dihydrofolate synthase/folylpolyglutamate synthase
MPATYEEALEYLDGLTNLGIKPGLSRMRALADILGNPQRCAPVVHITGTNGKTSTARIASGVLESLGLRSGTYTSPHLQVVNERIAIDLRPLSNEEFASVFDDALAAASELYRIEGEKPSYFEMVTLMAFAAFSDAPVGVQVIEVGMGGRWDATNIADADVAVVTNVSVDHAQFLGSTPPLIATEKAGIIKEGTALVVGETDPELVAIFESVADSSGASKVLRNGIDFRLSDRLPAVGGQVISVEGTRGEYKDLFLPLFGKFQADNAAMAIIACEELLDKAVDANCIQAALESVTSPGRMEVVGRHPSIILDGAHNPAGITACLEAVREAFAFEEMHVVFGVFEDKDFTQMLSSLSGVASSLTATQTSLARAAPASRIASVARKLGMERVAYSEDVGTAIDAVLQEASEDDLILVTGSLYMIGEARTHILGLPDL